MFRRVRQFAPTPLRAGSAIIGTLALAGSVLAPPAAPHDADDATSVDHEYLEHRLETDALLNENRQSAVATDQAIQQASVELDALSLTASEIEAAISILDGEIGAAQAVYQAELDTQADAIRSATAVRKRITETELELEAWETLVRERAIAAYISPIRTPNVVPYLQSASMTELQTKMALLSVIAENDAAALEGLRSAREQLDDQLAEQEYLEAKASEGRQRTGVVREELAAKRAEQDALRAQLEVEIEAFRAEVEALEAARAELNRIIATREARFRAEAEQRARWRDECAAGLTPVNDNGVLIDCSSLAERPAPSSMTWPASGTVSSEFGPRWERMHEGLDIAAPTGTTIVAAEDGVVFFAGWLGGYGNATIIDHGGGVLSLYGHQDSIWVVDGQNVVRGEGIGAMGSSGNSTGPHLHFEVLVNGAPVDPRQFLG